MNAVAIIPARGGSKGIPGKNLQKVGGFSLVERAVRVAQDCGALDAVIVTTDDDEIAREAERVGAVVVVRPAELASDTASSESALLHSLDARPDLIDDDSAIAFLQCTSPFIEATRLADAVHAVVSGALDVSFAAVRSHGFLWTDDSGEMRGINHDHRVRLRRQDRPVEWLETGAFYVMRAGGLRSHEHRFFGTVGVAEVRPEHAIEIDDPVELHLARLAAQTVDPLRPVDVGRGVRALVMDFDGVHTDDRAIVTQDGVESAIVNRRDGMGLSMARDGGLELLIISKERVPIVRRRAEKLGIECIAPCDDKLDRLRAWALERGLDAHEIAYIGNDVNDRACLEWVGCPVIVQDAHPSLHDVGAHVTDARGGDGAIRELVDKLLARTAAHLEEEK